MTTANQDAALGKPLVRTAYFLELDFQSGIQYLNSTNLQYTWGGHDWIGFGTLGGMEPIEESDSIEPKAVIFTINHAQPSWLALAVGSVEDYRGRLAKLYFCPLDEGFQLIDTPEICWRGTMDTISIGMEGEEGKIMLKCETSAYGLRRRSPLRYNAAQHRARNPDDTGLDYLTDVIANPQMWISKRFQQI